MCIRDSFKTCKKKTVRKEWLEDLVLAESMKLIQDDAVIDAIVAEVLELQEQENTTLPLLEKQMREVENGIENMLNAIQAGVLTNSTKSRLEKLEAQQKELEAVSYTHLDVYKRQGSSGHPCAPSPAWLRR